MADSTALYAVCPSPQIDASFIPRPISSNSASSVATPPRGRRNILVLNAHEPAVSNDAARVVWSAWRERGADAEEIVIGDLDTRHDIIEPTTYPPARTLVYPVLVNAVDRPA